MTEYESTMTEEAYATLKAEEERRVLEKAAQLPELTLPEGARWQDPPEVFRARGTRAKGFIHGATADEWALICQQHPGKWLRIAKNPDLTKEKKDMLVAVGLEVRGSKRSVIGELTAEELEETNGTYIKYPVPDWMSES